MSYDLAQIFTEGLLMLRNCLKSDHIFSLSSIKHGRANPGAIAYQSFGVGTSGVVAPSPPAVFNPLQEGRLTNGRLWSIAPPH